MGDERTRRGFLGAGVALGVGGGLGTWSRTGAGARASLDDQLRFESEGGGFGAYEFTVSGDLRQVDDDDHVDGNRAWGHVGPERGTDTYRYSGELTGILLAGPARVYRNGIRTQLGGFPHPSGSLTAADFRAEPGTNVLRVDSDGGGVAAYEFAVTGSLAQRDTGDRIVANRAWGHVGPKRGTDTFAFTGEIAEFALAGPASVSLNGSPVTPDSGGRERGLVRTAPDREVAVAPDTTLLFEAVAPDRADEFLWADWYVDGRQHVGPGLFHGQLGGLGRATATSRFESAGIHDVRVEVYERRESGERGAHVGTAGWSVAVGADGNRAPAVELIAPDGPLAVSRESPERRTFRVGASDPEGGLDRVVWWETQCDAAVAVTPVEGPTATATLVHAPSAGCPLAAAAIDRDGAVSDLRVWSYDRED